MVTVRPFAAWSGFVVIMSGGFCVALGLIFLIGWHTQNLTLIRALPVSAPMYYNTAVGFFLCGVGVTAGVYGWLPLVRASGVLSVLLGLGTLSEYLGGIDLGIDQVAMRDISGFANPYPGRMAPTTAVCFALSGAALLLVGRHTRQKASSALRTVPTSTNQDRLPSSLSTIALLEFLGVLLAVLGLVTCVLYLTGLMTPYGWGRVVNMALATAAGFSVLGIGFVSLAWSEHRTVPPQKALWMSVLVGLAVASATLLLCQALLMQEDEHMEQAIAAAAASVRSEITTRMDMRILALARMAQRWEDATTPSQEEWESEAALNLRHFPGYQSLAWVDPALQVRWLVSRDTVQAPEDLRVTLLQYDQAALQAARAQDAVTVLPAINLRRGGKGFIVLVAARHRQDDVGFVVGLFAFQELLEALLKNIAPGYAVALYADQEEVYRRGMVGGPDEIKWGQETIIDPYGVMWRARVWPLPNELARGRSALPEVTLGAGVVMAFLSAWLVALAQAARRRARETTVAYIGLSAEMAERQRAEAALRVAHSELEQRVEERTAELARANLGLQRENLQRRRAEESLARQAQELARSNSELEHFAHIASHDLQEPLRKIQAFGDRLKLKCSQDLSEQGRDYVERMQSAAARMQRLISDLLTFSRVTTTPRPFVEVDLTAVAHTIVSDLEVSIQRVGGSVQIDQLPTIEADPVQMGQLLQNLIANALKFHRDGVPPQVKIQGTYLQDQEQNADRNGSAGRQCSIWVADNGIGFDEQYRAQIFQPFQRLVGREQYEGTGMGLAICKKIVERHGGTITAQSTLGQGTVFTVTFPCQRAQEETRS